MKKQVKRDRISELPEEIKEQILSSLCMKDAICTSSLSSVWRHTWVSRPSLDFGFYVYDQFTSYFKTLPTSHPKKRHLYCSIFHKAAVEEEEVDDTVDDSDIDYWCSASGSDSDKEWEISKVGYLQMLEEFMQVYIEKNQSLRVLKKMSLYVPKFCNSKMRDYGVDIVSRCLSLVKHNVTELDYQNYTYGWLHRPKDSYRVLQNCLPILESKTLTKLELSGCYLDMEKKVDVAIDLPNLKHLRLLRFNVRENMLETLLAKCPALETLNFSLCEGFNVLRIPRLSKLKELQVIQIYDLDLLEINALSLQYLLLTDLNTNKFKVKMASNSCNNLVNLFVHHCGITDDFFNNVAEFPHLETVSLKHCPELKHIKITGNSLTSLEIKECPNLSQAEVDTPKSFFTGYSSSSKNIIKRLFPKS
ncbi:putative FBD-associated F-box protein At5g22720 [Silene latifolia]|uniref:putative FBD-associated F-box protein At5g22720 n=1 Tax=Silene latifolia TaxID=37657 RepID=UPI003D77A86A